MNRLTQKRVNGIKTGYWSTSKKDELVARLAEYEDTGLEPREVLQLKKNAVRWIPVTERLPDPESYILVSFENFSLPDTSRKSVALYSSATSPRRSSSQYWLISSSIHLRINA